MSELQDLAHSQLQHPLSGLISARLLEGSLNFLKDLKKLGIQVPLEDTSKNALG